MADPTLTDTRFAAAKQDLVDAANKAGVDPGLLVKIAGFESGFNPHARPVAGASRAELNTITQFDGTKAMSSAYGYGQFLNATWGDMVREHGEKYGIANASELTNAQANTAALRNNTTLQAGMLAEFTKANMVQGAALGGADAAANVYAMHNLGGKDAPAFLKALAANPQARVDSVLSDTVVERNSALYGDGSITLAAAYKNMGAQMERYAKYANEVTQAQGQGQGQPPSHSPAGVSSAAPASIATPASPAARTPGGSGHGAVHPLTPGSVLQPGAHGNDVRTLQRQLGELGFTDAHGQPLKADGHFGPATRAAVEAFQEKHHLEVDGVAGSATSRQLGVQMQKHAQNAQQHDAKLDVIAARMTTDARLAEAKPSLLSDESHPDNPLFKQAFAGMQKVDAAQGRASDGATHNVSGALASEARARGLDRIDYVVLSEDGSRAWAVQGNPNDPYKRYADVDLSQAVNQTMAQSSARWDDVVSQQASQLHTGPFHAPQAAEVQHTRQ